MANVRNKLIVEGKVLENLKNYANHLQEKVNAITEAIDRVRTPDQYFGEEPSSLDSIETSGKSIAQLQKDYAKNMDLLIAVKAILGKNSITKEQHQLLYEDTKIHVTYPATRQFIISYLQNYIADQTVDNSNSQQVDTKDKEDEIYARASDVFTTKTKQAKATEKAREAEEAKKMRAAELEARYEDSKPSSGASFLTRIFGKGTSKGPVLNINDEDVVNDKTSTKKR